MTNTTRRRAEAAAGLALLLTGAAQAASLEGPAGAELALERSDYGRLSAPVAAAENGPPPRARLDGAHLLRVWRMETGAPTPLEALEALRRRFSAEGYETALFCESRACGGYDFYAALDLAPPPEMALGLDDFAHLTMRQGDAALLSATASALGGVLRMQAELVETVEAPPPPAPEAPAAETPDDPILAALTRAGHFVLDGVDFVVGSTDIAPGSAPMLDAAAEALAAAPELRVAVVGHTDASGDLELNLQVSRARAQAVLAALRDRGVAAERLSAEGVGWLSPRASNADETGRALNRRVELVAR